MKLFYCLTTIPAKIICDSPQIKQKLTPSIRNVVYEIPHELSNNLRITTLENQKVFGKFQIWLQTKLSAKSPF